MIDHFYLYAHLVRKSFDNQILRNFWLPNMQIWPSQNWVMLYVVSLPLLVSSKGVYSRLLQGFFAKKEVKITTFGLAFQAKKALNSIVEGHFEAMAFEVTASP